MKDISLPKKIKVIKLFFAGYTYDEIVAELGISKGSVFNIIDQFSNGKLPIPMNYYIGELRKLVTDIRQQGTSVKKLKMYAAIDQKLGGDRSDHRPG